MEAQKFKCKMCGKDVEDKPSSDLIITHHFRNEEMIILTFHTECFKLFWTGPDVFD